jgi:phosphopantetheinyl transferase
MPLIRTTQGDDGAKIGIWHITEPEGFFLNRVQVEREVHHPHKRLQHLAARYLLTALRPGFPVSEIRVAPSRKPYLPGHPCHFSLAHCGDYAVAAISGEHVVGIDVERISPQISRVASKFLSPAELQWLPREEHLAVLAICWSAKEAVVKWYGRGGVDFRGDIRLSPFTLAREGSLEAHFSKSGVNAVLRLHYIREADYQVSWVAQDPPGGRPWPC